jgi:DNA-binding NtrC family response regulator
MSLPGSPAAAARTPATLADAVADCERATIRSALDASGGNMSAAARALGLERSSLYKKMKALSMGDSPAG